MPVSSPQENLLRVSTNDREIGALRIAAGAPVTVQLEVENTCSCGGSVRRAGAYTDTDFGIR
jgi:hypothetical protein